MKSVFRVWKRRGSSKTTLDDDTHLPLQSPLDTPKQLTPSPSPSPSYHAGPSRPSRPPAPPSLASPVFKDSFSHSIEEALQRSRGQPQHASGNYPTTPRASSYRLNDSPPLAHHSNLSHTASSGGSPSRHHGPRDTMQGRASLVPSSQSPQIPTSNAGPHSAAWTISSPSRSQVRSPTRVNFDTPVDVLDTATQLSNFSFSRASSSLDRPEEGRGSRRPSPLLESHTRLPHDSPSPRISHRRGSKDELSAMPPSGQPGLLRVDTTDPRTRRSLATTRSTPHLRPNSEYPPSNDNPLPPLPIPSPSDPNFVSYFPSPPPLIIRKKRPQPLVLNPQTRTPSGPPVSSPNLSSTDSTPVATPQSALQFPSSPTPPKLNRKASVIPPLVHSPPTSPLPSPPPPHILGAPPPRRTAHSFHSSSPQLKPSRSAINLRVEGAPPSIPTHRMTSSDPIAEVGGQPMKHRTGSPLKLDSKTNNSSRRFDRKEERGVASSQEGAVQWGYAL